MATQLMSSGVFVSSRSGETKWAGELVIESLRRQPGEPSVIVHSPLESVAPAGSLNIGKGFARSLEDGVRRSAVFLPLIGPSWDRSPYVGRLFDSDDWVRREILLAEQVGSVVMPVLVDRDVPPDPNSLPHDLRFLSRLESARLSRGDGGDEAAFERRIARLLDFKSPASQPPAMEGSARTQEELRSLMRRTLPRVQQWSGNLERLVELAMNVLAPTDRLAFLAPARLEGGPRGSAAVLITELDVVVVQVDQTFAISGEIIRFPQNLIEQVEVIPTLPLFADALIHLAAGDILRLVGLLRDQASQLSSRLDPGSRARAPLDSGDSQSTAISGDLAWDAFGRALEEHGDGFIYIGGDPSSEEIHALERALGQVARARGVNLYWEEGKAGSWFRRFFTSLGRRFGEHDLDTLKRAGEVHILDRFESQSASSYAEAIASLGAAAAGVDHAVLLAKNTVLIKTRNSAGEPIVIARTLTSAEVNELSSQPQWLDDPKLALDFVTRKGQREQLSP